MAAIALAWLENGVVRRLQELRAVLLHNLLLVLDVHLRPLLDQPRHARELELRREVAHRLDLHDAADLQKYLFHSRGGKDKRSS